MVPRLAAAGAYYAHDAFRAPRVRGPGGWGRTDAASGEIALWWYLVLALLVRLPAVFFSRGYDFLDHQFQYVDPAYHLGLGGSWWQPYEYVEGLRSWVYPGLLAGLFRTLDALGLHEPNVMMTATRLVHALVGLVPLALLWLLVVRWQKLTGQTAFLLFAAANALSVYTSVQPTGPTFATGFAVAAVIAFHGPGRLWPLVSGLCLGVAFACRFQDAFFGPVLLAAGIAQRRWVAIGHLALGAGILIAAQGTVDLATWGGFLHSPFAYVRWNVLEDGASGYGVEPFWFYLPLVVLVLVLVPPFVGNGLRALVDGGRALPVLLASSGFYLLLHSVVARKAPRFILPALVLLAIVYAAGLFGRARSGPDSRLAHWHRRVFLGVHAVALVAATLWYPNRGPVEAARALSTRRDFVDRLAIVDGGMETIGGHFYLGRDRLQVDLVSRRELAAWLAANGSEAPLYLLVVGTPLDGVAAPPPLALTLEGYFHDWPDVRQNTRRYLYRLSPP